MLGHPPPSKGQHHGKASSPASKLIGKEAATAIQSHVPPRSKPTPVVERILMVDFPSTQAQAKEVDPLPTTRGPR
jgi:hypothetical protein